MEVRTNDVAQALQPPLNRCPTESRAKNLLTFAHYYFSGLRSCAFLFGWGFLWGRHRGSIYKIASELGGLPDPNKPTAILPNVPWSAILPATEDVSIVEPVALDGNVTLFELIIINQLLRRYHASNCFEIGTFDGRTTANLAANCAADGSVYSLDLPQEKLNSAKLRLDKGDVRYIAKQTSGQRFKGTKHEAKICQLYGDSADFDYAPFVGRMDFVFVDGAHSYEYVLNDSLHALELLSPKGGIVLWHDYDSWAGVTNCLNALYTENLEFRSLRHIEGTKLAFLAKDFHG
ncbi:MAG TPA: class I SAM-dependent methyltransferase [Terriglobales bacterium]|nr:class I SAM-dependent methyltransferase [Terriglobales bacterium]